MNSFLKNVVLKFVCIILVTTISVKAQDSIPFSVKALSNTMYLFEVNGVNMIVLHGAEGTLLVDAGYAEAAPLLRSKLNEAGSGRVKFLVNTHWHFDHAGGNPEFSRESSVIGSLSTRNYLSTDQQLLGSLQKALPPRALPSIIVRDTTIIVTGDEIVKIIAMPGGHTDGDVLVWFTRAGIVHIGDIVFADMFPFIDTEHGGNVFKDADVIASIRNTFPAGTRFIPGHGRELNMDDLRHYEEMIRTTAAIVKKELKKKRTVGELMNGGILNEWKQWGVSFSCDDWICMIAKSL